MTETRLLTRVVVLASCLVSGAIPLPGADLSMYRGFKFGTDLAGVAGQAGANGSQVKVIHRRPALIQELVWRSQLLNSPTQTDSVQDVTFSFIDGKLFRIVVNYDRYETAGLTAGDVIESLSEGYGTPASLTSPMNDDPMFFGDQEEVVAVWQDPRYRFTLTRTAYGPSYKLTGVMTHLEISADAAIAEARRLDDLEAPERAAARLATEMETERIKLEKSRALNKAKFRP